MFFVLKRLFFLGFCLKTLLVGLSDTEERIDKYAEVDSNLINMVPERPLVRPK